ncbi:MAG: biotin synthase BioB [Deltaproteobacteria bacterium]|nr:biotin synthase BioB [Deltaproteobacteria bacterium]
MFPKTIQAADLYPQGADEDQVRAIIFATEEEYFNIILPLANEVRKIAFGNEVSFCSIVNAKSGACVETCNFCSQSASFKGTQAPLYPLMKADQILEKAKEAESFGGTEFSIVTSGRAMNKKQELDIMVDALTKIKEQTKLESCASLGLMKREDLLRLKAAGMQHLHHNIETAKSFFPNVVQSHTWEEEVETIKVAKELGLETCCGGIMGMGESLEQRVEFILQLKEIDPHSIPINFLNPRPGTPFAGVNELTPLDCLKIISALRLAMPSKDLIVCGGREVNLRKYQDKMFEAGASGTMLGNYLTTRGRDVEDDRVLVARLGLKAVAPHRRAQGLVINEGCHLERSIAE